MWGIRAKLILCTSTIVLLFGLSVLVYSIYTNKQRIIAANSEKSMIMMQGLSRLIAERLWYMDYKSLDLILDDMTLMPDLQKIWIVGPDSLVLHDGTQNNSDQKQLFNDLGMLSVFITREWEIKITDHTIKIAGPVIGRDASMLGAVIAEFSLKSINSIVGSRVRIDIGMVLFWLCAAILVTAFFAEVLISPLGRIVVATQRIGDGDLRTKITVRGSDEIAVLAESINSMAANLMLITASRDDLNREIEGHREAKKRLEESMEILQRTQKKLVESEKHTALGSLVAGIAHEINTPVGMGMTAASHLSDKTEKILLLFADGSMKRSELERYLASISELSATIVENMEKAATLIQNFKQVAIDQSTEERREFNVNDYLESILISLHAKMKQKRPTICIDCPRNLVVTSFPGAFSQIITNLIMNSVAHRFTAIEQGIIQVTISATKEAFHLDYHDNGPGMTKEQTQRIFDPFSTIKQDNGESGLGMHIVYTLITRRFNGTIECRSSNEYGTTFLIQIPFNDALQQGE